MGILQSALTSKSLERQGNENYIVGSCAMQGCRMNMEDAHKVALQLPKHPNTAFFGVFDGHGGKAASKFVEETIVSRINDLPSFSDENISEAFVQLDTEFIADTNAESRENGTTCVFILCTQVEREEKDAQPQEFELICANLGDSRCLLLSNDGSWQPMSKDHKPDDEIERTRIEEARGMVRAGRVDGSLAVSRAFGDWSLKCDPELSPGEQKVSCVPDIKRATCKKDDFIFLCCDGIFEHLQNQQVVSLLREHYDAEVKDPALALTYLFEAALSSGSTDNMSGVLIHLTNGSEYNDGKQYIPGPLFSHQTNHTFFDAYVTDARTHGFPNNSLLKLMGYQQDLVTATEGDEIEKKRGVEQEIKALEPETMGIEALSHVINTLKRYIFVKDHHLETLRKHNIKYVQDVTTVCNSPKWDTIDLPENVKSELKTTALCWDAIPVDAPNTPLQNYDEDTDTLDSSGSIDFGVFGPSPQSPSTDGANSEGSNHSIDPDHTMKEDLNDSASSSSSDSSDIPDADMSTEDGTHQKGEIAADSGNQDQDYDI